MPKIEVLWNVRSKIGTTRLTTVIVVKLLDCLCYFNFILLSEVGLLQSVMDETNDTWVRYFGAQHILDPFFEPLCPES